MDLLVDGSKCSKPRAPSFRYQEEFVFLGELILPDEERSYLGHNVHTRCKPVLDQAPSDAFRFLARGHRDQDHEGVLPFDGLHLFSPHRLTSLSRLSSRLPRTHASAYCVRRQREEAALTILLPEA